MNIAVQDLLDGGRCEVPSVMRDKREDPRGEASLQQANPCPLRSCQRIRLSFSDPFAILSSCFWTSTNINEMLIRPPPTTSTQPVAPIHVFEAYLSTADPDIASPFPVRRSKKGPTVSA
jgi:hypothetical protein